MAKAKPKDAVEILRQAIRESPRTTYKIATLAKCTPEQLYRFMRGLDIRLGTAAKVMNVLGLEIVKRK